MSASRGSTSRSTTDGASSDSSGSLTPPPRMEGSKPMAAGMGDGSQGGYSKAMTPEEEARMKEQMEADAKRQKRLALNRKAAHESRKRKKVKFAALTKSLEDLNRENEETQEQNELLRELLSTPQMNRFTARREMLQAENTQLRLALLTALQALTDEMGQRGAGGVVAGPPPHLLHQLHGGPPQQQQQQQLQQQQSGDGRGLQG